MNAHSKVTEAAAVDRRRFLGGGAAVAATIAISGTALIHAGEAWGLDVKVLKPETMLTLIKMSRDIYPHDKLDDKYYAVACKSFDDAATKDLMEQGVAKLNQAAGGDYAKVSDEAKRVALLKGMESDPFFQKVRGGLIVGIYNNQEVWPIFGYEGASADKGGYIKRGFNDITWL